MQRHFRSTYYQMYILFYLLSLVSKLQENQQTRLMPKFDDDENKRIDHVIRTIVREMTQKLKECDVLLKQLLLENTNSALEEQSTFLYNIYS